MARDFERGSSERVTRSAYITSAVDNFSMVAWVKCESIAGNMSVVSNGFAVPYGQGYQLAVLGTGKVRWDAHYVGSVDSSTTLSAGTWYHLAAVRNSGTTTLYINGSSEGTTATTPNALTSVSKTAIGALASDSSSWIDHFDGLIQNVAMYSRALSAGEVYSLSRGMTPAYCNRGLLFYKPLWGTTPEVELVDSSGSWTLTGGAKGDHTRSIIYTPYAWNYAVAVPSLVSSNLMMMGIS